MDSRNSIEFNKAKIIRAKLEFQSTSLKSFNKQNSSVESVHFADRFVKSKDDKIDYSQYTDSDIYIEQNSVNNFEVIKRIGEGGFGEVYLV